MAPDDTVRAGYAAAAQTQTDTLAPCAEAPRAHGATDGSVTVRVVVGPDGVVRESLVLQYPPALHDFARCAAEHIARWRFAPRAGTACHEFIQRVRYAAE